MTTPVPPAPPLPPSHIPAPSVAILNEVAGWAFLLVALAIIFFALPKRGLPAEDRNAGVTAAMGLMLCGRYVLNVAYMGDWVFACGVAGLMILLAVRSLKIGKISKASGRLGLEHQPTTTIARNEWLTSLATGLFVFAFMLVIPESVHGSVLTVQVGLAAFFASLIARKVVRS